MVSFLGHFQKVNQLVYLLKVSQKGNHKKFLFIEDNIIHISYSKINIDLQITIDNIKKISITNNEYLTLKIMEFINESLKSKK